MNTKTSPILVKKESCSDDIKDYAESAMNELLGWYGYDKINQNEIRPTSSKKRSSEFPEKNESSCSNSAVGICDDSEYESYCGSSKTHYVLKNLSSENICNWCRRTVSMKSQQILGSPKGPIFCSESCFSQSRRANFKRAKVCDWCKHVRNSVNYVDFQDNASQLQFCSDKCLNQYKMQIFCNETQAHLDMNPHLKEKIDPSNSLITPELWLKNCKSRSQSPHSEASRTPSPSVCPKMILPHSINQANECQIKKPIITVAPASKLLNKNLASRKSLRTMKRRLRGSRPNASISLRNIVSNEVNNNNHQITQSISQLPKLSQRDTQESNTSHPIRLPQPPPITILVPYPIILPIVIPIPIPIPIDSIGAKGSKTETTQEKLSEKSSDSTNTEVAEDWAEKDENAEHKLPKFKITRLSSKKVTTRECEKEKNRPLRKRKFNQHQLIELDDLSKTK